MDSSPAKLMLQELKQKLGRSLTTADVLMEFADRANRGEPLDKDDVLIHVDEFLGDVPLEKREALSENLARSGVLTALGREYRKRKGLE
ncbi:MAG: hypothetical protein Q8Q90_01840 [bacterium]|nr:hypothetical protein [bacterium]